MSVAHAAARIKYVPNQLRLMMAVSENLSTFGMRIRPPHAWAGLYQQPTSGKPD